VPCYPCSPNGCSRQSSVPAAAIDCEPSVQRVRRGERRNLWTGVRVRSVWFFTKNVPSSYTNPPLSVFQYAASANTPTRGPRPSPQFRPVMLSSRHSAGPLQSPPCLTLAQMTRHRRFPLADSTPAPPSLALSLCANNIGPQDLATRKNRTDTPVVSVRIEAQHLHRLFVSLS